MVQEHKALCAWQQIESADPKISLGFWGSLLWNFIIEWTLCSVCLSVDTWYQPLNL